MIKNKIFLILICFLLLLTGCVKNNTSITTNDTKESNIKMSHINIIINNKTYILKLENNETTNEFLELLPQEFTMNELNGNEKYYYMKESLTTSSYNPERIQKGDVMLYGDNCLVIFYKSFDTNYSYTKLGHIDNLDDLGNDDIKVKFEKNN